MNGPAKPVEGPSVNTPALSDLLMSRRDHARGYMARLKERARKSDGMALGWNAAPASP